MNAPAKTPLALLALFSILGLSACDLDSADESQGVFRSGSATYDAALDFDAANQGNNGWYYLYDATGNGTYAEMSVGATYWGHQAWRDASCTEASIWLGPDHVGAHTDSVNGCSGWTTLAWEAPSDGVADISVSVSEGNPCTHGIAFELRDANNNLLDSEYDTAWGQLYSHQDTLEVDAGERIYLRINQGPGGSWCDSTKLNFQVDHSVETELTVQANYDTNGDIHNDWMDTGIELSAGRQLDISATGLANHVPWGDMYDADGLAVVNGPTFLASGLPIGALVGRIDNGPAFVIGTDFSMPASASGRLYLGFNDSRCDDNLGQYSVTVTH